MEVNIFWFRRDLRLEDNAGLYHALKAGLPVIPIFIFDLEILDKLEDKNDARVSFIHDSISELNLKISSIGGAMQIFHGRPEDIWLQLISKFQIKTVFSNKDYEPYALNRDRKIEQVLAKNGIGFLQFKDHVIFEGLEIKKDDGTPYTVFTPYARKWKAKLEDGANSLAFRTYPCSDHFSQLKVKYEHCGMPSLAEMGFERTSVNFPSPKASVGIIKNYDKKRDFPAQDGTSKLGLHFRFGTISIREKAKKAYGLNETFLNELIWRDFYSMILQNFPHVATEPFRAKYKRLEWRNNVEDYNAWCEGKTGYPLVDAGMRELNETGFMHNRVRMITASFLTKHLLIDWRWGEAYFARKLLDFDLASNNGGWQWAAGCGTDAAPYFRIFNPTTQQKKFDPKFEYIQRNVPEFGTSAYPLPMVDHKFARSRCLLHYKSALDQN